MIIVFTGEAMGEAKAIDAAMAIPIRKASGLTPRLEAALSAIGAITTVVAVLEITWVKVAVSKNKPASSNPGLYWPKL
jgi:hypothetical protein